MVPIECFSRSPPVPAASHISRRKHRDLLIEIHPLPHTHYVNVPQPPHPFFFSMYREDHFLIIYFKVKMGDFSCLPVVLASLLGGEKEGGLIYYNTFGVMH